VHIQKEIKGLLFSGFYLFLDKKGACSLCASKGASRKVHGQFTVLSKKMRFVYD